MAQNHELNQLRADAEERDRVDSERRAEKRGWPVDTADGEIIIARSFHEGQTKVLETEDGEQYVRSAETHEWVSRGYADPASVDDAPADEPSLDAQPAADPLKGEVEQLTDTKEKK